MADTNQIFEINTKQLKKEDKNDLGNSQLNLISMDEGLEKTYGFGISVEKLEEIMSNYKERGADFKDLKYFREQNGITLLLNSLLTNPNSGISTVNGREKVYGSNKVFVEPVPPFCAYVWEALEDMMVRILIVCAIVQIVLGCTLSDDPSKDWIDGVSIIVAILVVVLVGSITNYQKETKFHELNEVQNEGTKYNIIRNDTLYQGIPLEAIYFNKKCIDIAKKNGHTESLIKSLIYMGDCFDKSKLPSDMNISKKFKEEAKDIYKEKLDGKNYPLEMSIYKALKDLYSELATQQEQSKNYKKAIELLNKLLEVLDTAKTISGKVKNCLTEKEIEDKKTEAYLKIANIYYIIKDYDNTIATLDLIPDIKKEDYSSLTVSLKIF